MTTKKDILDMYIHLRKTNNSISDEALDFMKHTCLEALEAKSKSCEWGIDDDEYNIWKTSCGHGWQFTEGGEPSEHGMKFCLGCGKPIELLQQ